MTENGGSSRKAAKGCRDSSAPTNTVSVLVRLPPGHYSQNNLPSPVYVVAAPPLHLVHSPLNMGPTFANSSAFLFCSPLLDGTHSSLIATDCTRSVKHQAPTPPLTLIPTNPNPISAPRRSKSASFHPYDNVPRRFPVTSMSSPVLDSSFTYHSFSGRKLSNSNQERRKEALSVSLNAEDALMDFLFDQKAPPTPPSLQSGPVSLPQNHIPEWARPDS
ncbi:hypothetical protein BJ741DRAFT_601986 [Chytriomyces cf. hyalinus JEL632]|nr:hypothetical protein BJ741DRAFT_601986 [Chytriomyces cf. hyalinus JEL632]